VLDKRLVLISGKGGVGKSAVAAGFAQLAARSGKKVLLVDMGDAGGLAAHLGTGPLEFEPREVKNSLFAMRMVRADALLEYLTIQLSLRGLNRFGALARAFDALATAAPAVREIVSMGKVLWEVREKRWDIVVADAPPTGQIGSYLRAPLSIAELVPTGRIQRQAAWMRHTLADPATTELLLVNLAEELPTAETLQTLEWLEENQLVPNPRVFTNRIVDELQAEPAGTGPVFEAAVHHQSVYREQQEWLDVLKPDATLPYLYGLLTPAEVAARMADILEELA
jgi:anion-transporting  ArsA/GET3 family ATPase